MLQIPDIFTLKYVPWGNAILKRDGEIECQHGKTECVMNTVMACVLHYYPDQWVPLCIVVLDSPGQSVDRRKVTLEIWLYWTGYPVYNCRMHFWRFPMQGGHAPGHPSMEWPFGYSIRAFTCKQKHLLTPAQNWFWGKTTVVAFGFVIILIHIVEWQLNLPELWVHKVKCNLRFSEAITRCNENGVIHLIDRKDFWPFLHCIDQYKEDMDLEVAEKCAGKTNVSWDTINTCQSGSLGHQ